MTKVKTYLSHITENIKSDKSPINNVDRNDFEILPYKFSVANPNPGKFSFYSVA